MTKMIDLSLDSIRLNGKDVVQIIALVVTLYAIYDDVKDDLAYLKQGQLEQRIASLDMELFYLSKHDPKDKAAVTKYNGKVKLRDIYQLQLAKMQNPEVEVSAGELNTSFMSK